MKRIVLTFIVLLLCSFTLFAGNYSFNTTKTGILFSGSSSLQLSFSSQISSISFRDVSTRKGMFTELQIEGYGHSNKVGDPALPEYGRLIEVPFGAEFEVVITKQDYREYKLSDLGIMLPVIPAQASLSKSITDPDKIPFVVNKQSYLLNQWLGNDLVKVSPVGIMRSVNLARIDIAPVWYNPAQNTIRVYENIEARIIFKHGDLAKTGQMKQKYNSMYFRNLFAQLPNYTPPADSIITDGPVTYVIVAPPLFRDSLQRFVNWKIKKGFKVIQAYTDDPNVGATATTIKLYLKNLYLNPPAGYNPQSFVLIVGDVAQVPASSNSGQPTDLRYCEYTGDNIPEAFYGRFSATNQTQLKAYIDRTLEYEQYLFPDDSFLNEVVMVAGYDGGGNGLTYGNGQINYGTNNYFNTAHGLLSHTYLQPEPSGANYSQQIRNNVSDGVAFANYTAHGSVSGWADPSFTISNIPALQNNHKYGLLIGNCCVTSTFSQTCFAEEITRTPNKGALGYIGASNNSLWDEDYWWGVGYKNVSTNPAYNAAKLGAYDVTFHDHGEPTAKWFLTMGQMVVGGNLAVEQSNSSNKKYYWEIYNLMGDPSLMVYYSVPPVLTASYPDMMAEGTSSMTVTTEPWAYVALSMNDTSLLAAQCADSTGIIDFTFEPVSGVEKIFISVSKQNRRPVIDSIPVVPFVVAINLNHDTVCQYDTALLSVIISGGSGTYTYEWSPVTYLDDPTSPNPIAVPGESTIYSVTVNDGAHYVVSLPRSLEVKSRPESPQIMVQGDSLVSSIIEGNQWYRYGEMIPFANGASYKPEVSGDYYSIVSSPLFTCSSLPSNTIPYYFTAVVNQPGPDKVSVYPNPSRDEFTIFYTLTENGISRISLLDGMGKEIRVLSDHQSQVAGNYTLSVRASDLLPGFYFCKIQTASYNLVKKILVSK